MSNEQKGWTKKEVAEAFACFHNPRSTVSKEETTGKLTKILEEFPQALLSNNDISSIAEKFVASHCVLAMTTVIINKLEENRKSN